MTSQQPIPPKKRPQASGVAELRQQLAERDKRLAELTEQSLQILDRLAEAREGPTERASLYSRIAELQELLADTRQRIRLGTRAVLGVDAERSAVCELAVWALSGGDSAQLGRTIAEVGVGVTALMGPEDRLESFAAAAGPGVSVHETDCRSPAHFWNEAMAMTHAPVVVLVAAGTRIEGASIARLAAAAAADGIAIASPAITCNGARSLGRSERSLLDLVPQNTGLQEGIVSVPFASPEVFAISRVAFATLGPFDQDLVGDLALAEWVLRAGVHSQRCVAVADAEATVAQLREVGAESPVVEADRLVILARHRPQQLAAAALAANNFWQQDPMATAGTLRAIFRRLPKANELTAAVDLLVVQAQTVAGWKRLAPVLRERLIGIASEMRVPIGDIVSDPGLVTLAERLQGSAAVLRERSAELEVRNHEAHELRHQVEQRDRLEQELRQDIIARSNTIDSLRHELLERERAIASLREELGHRQGERDRLIDHLGNVQQDIDRLHEDVRKLSVTCSELESERNHVRAELGGQVERLRAELAGAQQQVARLEGENQQLPVARQRIDELERQHAAELERSREIERQLGQAVGRTLELDPQLSQARHTLGQLEQMRAEESERLGSVLREIDELRGGHESLRREHGSLQEQRVELEARAHELVLALRDRERWIAALLHEVQQRRLLRRELTPFEAEFLARHGDGKPNGRP